MTTKERPILYCGSMVRAVLDDSKTQTRRAVTPQPVADSRFVGGHYIKSTRRTQGADISVAASYVGVACPYGQPGDRLWVRETFFAYGRWETRFSAKKGRDEWHFIDLTLECGHKYAYVADGHSFAPHQRSAGVTPCWWKRPAIFMPRSASRIALEIVSVRVERLQACNEVDAIAEGAPWSACGSPQEGSHKAGYAQLWEQINGPGSWDLNPWVWVVEFKRVTP